MKSDCVSRKYYAARGKLPRLHRSPRAEFPRRVLGPTAINSFYFWGQVLLLLGKLLAFASSSKVGKMFKFNKYAAAHTHNHTHAHREIRIHRQLGHSAYA